jgi:hypothetical protein
MNAPLPWNTIVIVGLVVVAVVGAIVHFTSKD